VFAAFRGYWNEGPPFPGREGVFFDEAFALRNVFFITLKKSSACSPPPPANSTDLRHLAPRVSLGRPESHPRSLIHGSVISSPRVRQRVLLSGAGGEQARCVTLPFLCLAFPTNVSTEAELRWRFRWRLQRGDSGRPSIPQLAVWSVKGVQGFSGLPAAASPCQYGVKGR